MINFAQFNYFRKFSRILISFIVHYVFSNESKITNFHTFFLHLILGKTDFLRDLGRLFKRIKSISKYLENYFDFGSEKDNVLYAKRLFWFIVIIVFRSITFYSIWKKNYDFQHVKMYQKFSYCKFGFPDLARGRQFGYFWPWLAKIFPRP